MAATWLVRESSSGDLFIIVTRGGGTEEVYETFARVRLKMDTVGDFDSGDVDIDVFALPEMEAGEVTEVSFPRDE